MNKAVTRTGKSEETRESVGQSLELAVLHHSAGRLSQAGEIYRRILQTDPGHPAALRLLGVIAYQEGKNEKAIEILTKALAVKPGFFEAHNNLGLSFQALGRMDEAVSSFRKALDINSGYAEAHNNLGNAFNEAGRLDEAVACYHRAIAINPENAKAHFNLADALRGLDRPEEAAASYRRVLAIEPENVGACNGLGNILKKTGKPAEAVELYRKAIAINPALPELFNNLGVALQDMGRLDEALESYRTALGINAGNAESHYNLGNALREMSKPGDAVAGYEKALAINPEFSEAHCNLGLALQELGMMNQAITSFKKAIAINPAFAEAHNSLGNAFQELGLLDEALAGYRNALSINADSAAAHSNRGIALQSRGLTEEAMASYRKTIDIDPFLPETHSNLIFIQDLVPGIGQAEQQAERKLWNDRFIAPLADEILPHANDRNPDRRLRIGYVSADFRLHSACLGFGSLIMDFDRQNFDVICYDGTVVTDDVSQALRAAATGWRRVGDMGDGELANTIRDDAIDILVDLSGHTRGNRLEMFGLKPAPVQASGIGHLSPGISTIDYRLTSPFMTPPAEEGIYPEAPVYLNTYFGFTPPPDPPPPGPSPCLQNGYVTFGFLGRFNKTSDQLLACWAGIIRDTPQSRLLLKYGQLDDHAGRQAIKGRFSGLGVSEDRLILLGRTDRIQHLAAHNMVDIVFDTFPNCGGITTVDSLYMGVPVVGLANPDKAGGRIVETICRPLALDDWIARRADEYHAIAVQRAAGKEQLSDLRRRLRGRVSDVFSRFHRDVESAYRSAWKRWCGGQKPAPLYPS